MIKRQQLAAMKHGVTVEQLPRADITACLLASSPCFKCWQLHGAADMQAYCTAKQCCMNAYAGRKLVCVLAVVLTAGYDFINRAEVTAGRFMQAAGYKTAHFGKW